jgi:hypothetical protein
VREKGQVETPERSLKQVHNRLCLTTKRRKVVKLVPAIIAVIFLSLILSGLITVTVRSLYQTSSTISSIGTLKAIGIGVYWNDDLTNRVSTINWGYLMPGGQKSFTIYVHNEGTIPLTLSISTSNWSPSTASNYLTLTWSHIDQAINAGKTVEVTLTLIVSESITGISRFNFDIIAVGS